MSLIALWDKELDGLKNRFGWEPAAVSNKDMMPYFRSTWDAISKSIIREIAVRSGAGVFGGVAAAEGGGWFRKKSNWFPSIYSVSDVPSFFEWVMSCEESARIKRRKSGRVALHDTFESDDPVVAALLRVSFSGGPLVAIAAILVLGKHYITKGYSLDGRLTDDWLAQWSYVPLGALLAVDRFSFLPDTVVSGMGLIVNTEIMEISDEDIVKRSRSVIQELKSVSVSLNPEHIAVLLGTGEEFVLPGGSDIIRGWQGLYFTEATACDLREVPASHNTGTLEIGIAKHPNGQCTRFVPKLKLPSGVFAYHNGFLTSHHCLNSELFLHIGCVKNMVDECKKAFSGKNTDEATATRCTKWLEEYTDGVNEEGLQLFSGICEKRMELPICATMCRVANKEKLPHFCEEAFAKYVESGACANSEECANALRCRNETPAVAPVAANKECWWKPCHNTQYQFLSNEVHERMARCRYRLLFTAIEKVRLANGAKLLVHSSTTTKGRAPRREWKDWFRLRARDVRILAPLILLLCLSFFIRKGYTEHAHATNRFNWEAPRTEA